MFGQAFLEEELQRYASLIRQWILHFTFGYYVTFSCHLLKRSFRAPDIDSCRTIIPCSSCPAVYTGETGRTLKVRMAEHKRAVRMGDVNNGLAVHVLKTGHPIEWSQVRVVERKENWCRRRIKEALKIQQCQVRMNLDQGIVLRSGWKPFL